MHYYLDDHEIDLDLNTHPDIKLARNLGRELVLDDCSAVEIGETIEAAFPDIDLQTIALMSALTTQAEIQSRRRHWHHKNRSH